VKKEEILIQTDNVKVRLITLQPAEIAALHHHTDITDHMFGVSGEILVRMENPARTVTLTPGVRCSIDPGQVHQVINCLPNEQSEYLLIQGVGIYDFIRKDA
jgi:mannose-6-phosphate isomerase-like protein (cupin superfamily)